MQKDSPAHKDTDRRIYFYTNKIPPQEIPFVENLSSIKNHFSQSYFEIRNWKFGLRNSLKWWCTFLICKNLRKQKTIDKIRTRQFDKWKNATCYDWLYVILKSVSDLRFLFLCWCFLNIRPKIRQYKQNSKEVQNSIFSNGKQFFFQIH